MTFIKRRLLVAVAIASTLACSACVTNDELNGPGCARAPEAGALACVR